MELTEEERRRLSSPSFRISGAGGRRPKGALSQGLQGAGEAAATIGSAVLGSVPAGLAGAAVLPFRGPQKAAETVEAVQEALTYVPRTQEGVRAVRGAAGPLEAMGAPAQYIGDVTRQATGSPALATAAEVLLDPLNLAGSALAGKAAASGARAAGRAGALLGRELGPKAAEMAEGYMRRAGMMPQIFIGKSAKTWDATSNAKAVEMEKAGADPRVIWSETGNWRGPDKQWRQEISDAEAKLSAGPKARVLGDVLEHPELFKAYPEMRRTKVEQGDAPSYTPSLGVGESKISLGSRPSKSSTLHEASHEIQEREGFSEGANPEFFQLKYTDSQEQRNAFNAFANLSEKLGGPKGLRPSDLENSGDVYSFIEDVLGQIDINKKLSNDEWRDLQGSLRMAEIDPGKDKTALGSLSEQLADTLRYYTEKGAITPTQQYMKTAGEAEARAVEGRMNLTPEQRRATFPEESYDVPIGELTHMRGTGETALLTTYHGTPHTFPAEPGLPLGRFRAEKIGSGEGQQMYGHGIYVAETPEVGKGYKNTLSYRDMVKEFRKELPDDASPEEALEIAGKIDARRGNLIKELAANDWLGFDYPSQAITAAFKELDSFDATPDLVSAVDKAKGSFYTIDLPDPVVNRMLDWDAPVSEQPEVVQKVLQDLAAKDRAKYGDGGGLAYYMDDPDSYSGESVYKYLTEQAGGQKEASALLQSQGVPGVKYFDQFSRDAGEGTRNFVVFPGEEQNLKLLERDGLKLEQAKLETPEFKRFTAGAPMVKAAEATKHEFQTGKPVVIEGFHGTKRGYEAVDPAQASAGYFTTSKPAIADEYAGVYPEGMGGGAFPTGGNVQRSYVRMDNPLFVNARGASFNRIDTRGVPGFGLPMSNTDMLNQWAKQQGFDGVIYKDLRDSMARPGGQNVPASNVYVSFKPNYVKSAIGNRGTFDVREKDMAKAGGGAVEGGNMSFAGAADEIARKLVSQGMSQDQAMMLALRMSDARMKAGGAVMMAGGGPARAGKAMSSALQAARAEARAVQATQKAAEEAQRLSEMSPMQRNAYEVSRALAEQKTPITVKPDTVQRMMEERAAQIMQANPKLTEEAVAARARRDTTRQLKWERQGRERLQKRYGELSPSRYDMPAQRKLRNLPGAVDERVQKAQEFLSRPTPPWEPPKAELQAFDRNLIKDALEGFPGIEQTRFPRYEAPRAQTGYIDEIYDDPRNRELIKQQIKRGLPLGGETFYASLYPVKVAAMERGIPAEKFDRFVYETAPASARNSIMNEMAVGQFMRDMKARGLPLDEQTVKEEMARFKQRYGTGLPLMPVHREGVRTMVESGANMRDLLKADIPTNYKIPTYGAQKAGDFGKSMVLDVHESAGQTQGSRFHPYFTEQGGFGPTEYGLAEGKMLDIAKELGIPGGTAQAGRWFGGGELTGLKSPRGDALDLLEKQTAYTLQGQGINPTPKAVRDHILNMVESGEGVLMPYFKSRPMPDYRTKKAEGGAVSKEEDDDPSMALIAEILLDMAKKQGKKEAKSLSKPRATTDLLNRGVVAPLAGMPVDLVNMGLEGVDAVRSLFGPVDTKLASEKPFLGSEYLKDLMDQYNMTSGEERPMMETGLSIFSPGAAIRSAAGAAESLPRAARAAESGINRATAAAARPFVPATVTMEAVAPDLAKFKPRQWQETATRRLTGPGAPVSMDVMGGQRTTKRPGQGVYENFAGDLETNPLVAIDVPRAGNLSTNTPLRRDIAQAGSDLAQESVAAHRFVPMMTNQIKDASAMLIKPKGGSLSNEQVIEMAKSLPGMIVAHNPRLGGVVVMPFDYQPGKIPPEFRDANQVARKVLGDKAAVTYGKADPVKDRLYIERGDYAGEGIGLPSAETTKMRQRLQRAEQRLFAPRQPAAVSPP